MPGPLSYRRGRIVWAYLPSNVTGKRAAHPAIILDRDEDIIQPTDFDPRKADNNVHVVGVSTIHEMFEELLGNEDY